MDVVRSVCRELIEAPRDFRFRSEDRFRVWLFKAALNKIRDKHRFHERDASCWCAHCSRCRRNCAPAASISSDPAAIVFAPMNGFGERNLLEAYLHGWAVICVCIGATLTMFGAIMAACSCGLWCLAIGLPALPPAAALELYSRLLASPR